MFTCSICKKPLEDDFVQIAPTSYVHKECLCRHGAELDKLNYKIIKIFGAEAKWSLIQKQISNFHDQGFSYRDIRKAVEYWFYVKDNSLNNVAGGIGIVPYIIDEAKEFWAQKAQIKNNVKDKDLEEYFYGNADHEVTHKEYRIKKPKNVMLLPLE